MSRRAQWILATVLLAVLAVLLGRELTREESLLGPRGRRDSGGAVPFQDDAVPVVVLAAPGPLPGESFERGREDIFRYEESPAVREARAQAEREAAERRRKQQEEARQRAAEEARRKAEEEARRRAEEAARQRERLAREQAERAEEEESQEETARPDPPSFPYRYDGLIGEKTNAIAILLDSEDERHYAQAGQVLDEAFRVERVGQLKLVLSFTDPLFEGEFRQVPLRMEGADSRARPTARR
jgi:hypothetical protein